MRLMKDFATIAQLRFACFAATALSLGMLLNLPAHGEFSLNDDGAGRLTILENGQSVLVYNYGWVEPDHGDAEFVERYRRASYIHPLYGLDGEAMTEDFPEDHPHHRGVFWTWPDVRVYGERVDFWHVKGHQLFESWVDREVSGERAYVHVRNGWHVEGRDEPVLREDVRLTVHPAEGDSRVLEFHLTFTNVSSEMIELRGRDGSSAGYGGFSLRADRERPDPQLATEDGLFSGETNDLEAAWTAWSARTREDGPHSGVAIVPHPDNPTEPQPLWHMRIQRYTWICASWPHDNEYPLEPGESVDLRYRLVVFRGKAEDAPVAPHADN